MHPIPRKLNLRERVLFAVPVLRTIHLMKKVLLLQGLFCCLLLCAQTIQLDKPQPGDALDDLQEFLVSYSGETPQKVAFYLGDRLLKARRSPPFRFEIRWNTRLENRIRIVATYASGSELVLEQTFTQIKADYEEEILGFQCFPFLDRALPAGYSLTSRGRQVEAQSLNPAGEIPLDLIIVMDVSGSMQQVLPEVNAGFALFLQEARARNYQLRMMIFDNEPRLIQMDQVPANLADLYRGKGQSVVWDALATASTMFQKSPRRLLLLISDGADDGSVHDNASVERLLFQTGAALVWLNPTTHSERFIARASAKSGGFAFFADGPNPWPILLQRLQFQYHLLAPDANWPIKLEIPGLKAIYPLWETE